ncbi:MAG TPA: ABC transporter permease [Nitrososphaerales archaeon]|nr:ABC transporter permease [Nitrososphaerales archaeon]
MIFLNTKRTIGSLRRLASRPSSLIGLVIIVAFYGWSLVEGILQVIAAALKTPSIGWALLPSNPLVVSISHSLLSPSMIHLMGTDDLGRDIWSRVLYAAPTDATVSILVITGGIAIGALVGYPAGYFGKGVEEINMRVTDLFLAFPALILALTIEATLGRNVVYAIIALVVVWWPSYARLLRGETLKIKHQKFIDAALLSGLSSFGIIVKHVFRSSLNTLISYATIDLGNTILVYSILSFLGLGVPAPAPEWGTMVASGLNYFPGQWWYSMLPGIVITVIVIGAALLGDGLRDMFAGEL